jgi:glycosyltransferase involved in cell wall biosynthesis
MKILQVSTADRGGGAEGSARNLFLTYRERGHASWLAVGRKYGTDSDVYEIPRVRPAGPRGVLFGAIADVLRGREGKLPGARRLARIADRLANAKRWQAWREGREEFDFPGTEQLLDLPPERPDIVHCHNLHGWYFDLRVLPALAADVPVILNLRDAWLLTGHCAYPCDCPRWADGCGQCPDLACYPGIRRDATAANRATKASILGQAKFYVTAPAQWLLDAARESTLPNAAEYRLVPNGIDLDVFTPGDQAAARQRLDLPAGPLVLFAASAKRNVYKDPDTMVGMIHRIAMRRPDVRFVCLGRSVPPEELSDAQVIPAPFQSDPAAVADYYRAADVFVHTARAEAFGKTTTESMACGTPVVATAVGGLCDQIFPGETGFLAPPGDAGAHAQAVLRLLGDDALRASCREGAARRGAEFGLARQADAFLSWYREILDTWAAGRPAL